MEAKELDRMRERIENWVSLVGKRRTEEALGIEIFGLKEKRRR